MTPKEKAKELVGKYSTVLSIQFSKEFALITVDEISKHCYEVMKPFWEEVKQEIEKL